MVEYFLKEQLSQLCDYACREVPYYKKLFLECGINIDSITNINFSKIPFMSQRIIQENTGDLLASKFLSFPLIGSVIEERSIGSSGFYTKLLSSENDCQSSQSFLSELRDRLYGIDDRKRYCTFHTASYQNNLIIDPQSIEKQNNSVSIYNDGLGTDSISRAYETIMDFEPDYIVAQPSIGYQLAAYIQQKNKTVTSSLKYIELTGEQLTDQNSSFIESVFRIKPVDSYTIKGVNCIAHACNYGHTHVLEDNVYVETVRAGQPVFGEIGEIVVTSLTNYTMPLIRYNTGDFGRLIRMDCPCGNPSPVLKNISGRKPDFISIGNLEFINMYSSKGFIEYTNEYISCAIGQVQVQRQDPFVNLIIRLKPAYYGWEKAVKQEFTKSAEKSLWNRVNWKLFFVKAENDF